MCTDATTLLGTNRKPGSDETKSTNTNNKSSKLTRDDFKTIYVSKVAADEEKDVPRKENSKNKVPDEDNDQYEVVDTSYVCIRLKQK